MSTHPLVIVRGGAGLGGGGGSGFKGVAKRGAKGGGDGEFESNFGFGVVTFSLRGT